MKLIPTKFQGTSPENWILRTLCSGNLLDDSKVVSKKIISEDVESNFDVDDDINVEVDECLRALEKNYNSYRR